MSFLLGHVAFILAFYKDGGNGMRLGYGALLYLYAIGIVYVIMSFGNIRPDDVVLQVGVVVYSLVIATMCHRAVSTVIRTSVRTSVTHGIVSSGNSNHA